MRKRALPGQALQTPTAAIETEQRSPRHLIGANDRRGADRRCSTSGEGAQRTRKRDKFAGGAFIHFVFGIINLQPVALPKGGADE
jgi:hypothetical protein